MAPGDCRRTRADAKDRRPRARLETDAQHRIQSARGPEISPMKGVLVLAAVAEIGTGFALLIVPSLVGRLLLGEELTGIAIPIARAAGIALIALGVACWPGTPLLGMLIYGAAVTLCNGTTAFRPGVSSAGIDGRGIRVRASEACGRPVIAQSPWRDVPGHYACVRGAHRMASIDLCCHVSYPARGRLWPRFAARERRLPTQARGFGAQS